MAELESLPPEPPRSVPATRSRAGAHGWAKGQSGNPATQFQPHVSGNPSGGHAALDQVRALAHQHAPAAFQKLVDLMESPNDAVAAKAAEAVLDRALGRPTQAVELLAAVTHVDLAALSDVELRVRIAQRQEKLAAASTSSAALASMSPA